MALSCASRIDRRRAGSSGAVARNTRVSRVATL
jgi:hypothetical protein